MVTEEDNIFDGLSYEEALRLVVGDEKYEEVYKKCILILEKIPMGWRDESMSRILHKARKSSNE